MKNESRLGMDQLQLAFFNQRFEIQYLRATGDQFQELFRRIMEFGYSGDFVAVRPHGKLGDLKCDGYLASAGTIFQCYAPKGMEIKKLTSKMDEDFHGAVKHWGAQMKSWVFVHNDPQGLPAPALLLLNSFAVEVDGLSTGHWALEELRNIVMALPVEKLELLFGAAPVSSLMIQVDNEDIDFVIKAVQRINPGPNPPLRAPSAGKLEANDLSTSVAALLTAGRISEPAVDAFLASYPDPGLGEAVAEAFRNKYRELKSEAVSPDEVFDGLLSFAGGDTGGAKRQAAALAVLSYFFERCDIFEEPVLAS
jgi:hypothetical protein